MDFFFNPKSVAVVGASEKGLGSFLLGNLLRGYQGKIFPVNPNYEKLQGLTCFPSVEDIPEPVDLALLLIPAKAAPDILKNCVNKGVRGAIIQSAGFSEVGEGGQKLSLRLLEIAKAGGLRLWGPNCTGLVDVPNKKFFTFVQPAITSVVDLHGSISLVVQSGMLSAGFLADIMSRHSIGIAKACSLGNKLDINECDVLEYLLADPDTKVVAMYLESFKQGRRFLKLASSSTKPVVVLKGGVSEAGAKAALSHTASLAGNSRITSNMLAAAGVVEAQDFHHMIDLARSLSAFPALSKECRVAIITFSGGAGILTCDLLEKNGLKIAQLAPDTLEELSGIFPPWMPPDNPVDLYPAMARIGRVAALEKSCEIILTDPGVDVVLFEHLIGVEDKEMDMAVLRRMSQQAGKHVAYWGLGIGNEVSKFQKKAHEQNIPFFTELNRAVECLECAASWQPNSQDHAISSWEVLQASEIDDQVWDEYDSKQLLKKAGLPVVEEIIALDDEEVLQAADKFEFPVVLKGLLPGVVHKSEMNLVHLNLDDEVKLRKATNEVLNKLDGQGKLLIQQQLQSDFELIVGFMMDQQFGPVVMVGIGGVLAELDPDVVFSPAPLSKAQALSLLERIRKQKLLNGFRGMAPLDRHRMAELIVSLGDFCTDNHSIKQVDLNPVIIRKGQPVAVDASIVSSGSINQIS